MNADNNLVVINDSPDPTKPTKHSVTHSLTHSVTKNPKSVKRSAKNHKTKSETKAKTQKTKSARAKSNHKAVPHHTPHTHHTHNTVHTNHTASHNTLRIKKRTLLVALAVIIVAAILFMVSYTPAKSAGYGDKVAVWYEGRLANGTLFDTNVKETALSAGIYNPQRKYSPLVFTIGSNSMIKGFENALVGMKVNEQKEVTIAPEDAYGAYDTNKTMSIPKVQQISLYFDIPRTTIVTFENFVNIFGTAPAYNKVFHVKGEPGAFSVLKYNGDNVTVSRILHLGDTLPLPKVDWNATVVNLTKTSYVLKQNPKSGQRIGADKSAVVTVTSDKIIIVLDKHEGDLVATPFGPRPIVKELNNELLVDANNPLAGQSLNFKITLVAIKDSQK